MSDHKKPQPPELIQALKEHRLPHDKPSQLADSFRHGWQAARRAQVVPDGFVLVPKSHLEAWETQLLSAFHGAAPRPPEAAAVDLALLSAIQRAGFMLVKGALGFELLKASQAVAQAAQTEVAPVQLPEPAAFALEWTFNGEERGMRLYDDETHCRFDAESDGGVCSPLYTEHQVRQLLAAAPQPPETQPKSCIPEIQPIGCKEAAPTTPTQPR